VCGPCFALHDSGTTGLNGLKSRLKSGFSSRVLFGALAIDALDKRANIVSKRAKFVAFSYVGSSASEMARANSSFQKNKVMQIFNVRFGEYICRTRTGAFLTLLPSSTSSCPPLSPLGRTSLCLRPVGQISLRVYSRAKILTLHRAPAHVLSRVRVTLSGHLTGSALSCAVCPPHHSPPT
jgi:hypothetical protein